MKQRKALAYSAPHYGQIKDLLIKIILAYFTVQATTKERKVL